MAARNRPRNGLAKDEASDTHEERAMWNTIVNDLKKLKTIQMRAIDVAKQQVELEAKLARYDTLAPLIKEIDELQELYREGVRLAEDEQKMLNEEPSDVIKNIGILAALRTASETEPLRLPQQTKPRNPKRQKIDTDGATDSPVPSPSVPPTVNKLKGQSQIRSVSVPRQPEPVVKIEEGLEGSKGPAGERAGKFFIGAEVAYKQAKQKEDGSQWIQCIITNTTDKGNKKIYEVQDPEPDENGAPGQVYKTTAAALIAIPGRDAILQDFSVGKHVLARYPETTTFYRAEVTGSKKEVYRLKFEDDQNQEMEVGRRFVLDVSSK
ncbi:MAG: hypothetical protein Q9164_006447 [Protoblastenia rupestris]